jgi:hypothetical protein
MDPEEQPTFVLVSRELRRTAVVTFFWARDWRGWEGHPFHELLQARLKATLCSAGR